MEEKIKRILVPYTVEYQIGPMEETYKGTRYFDLTQYYKYKHKEKLNNRKASKWCFFHIKKMDYSIFFFILNQNNN